MCMKVIAWACVALAVVSVESPAAPRPSGRVTEADVIRLFLDDSPQARLVLLRAEGTGAERRMGSEVPNPAVAYQIEDAAGVRDEFLTFEQQLPVTGRRSLLHERAEVASEAAELLAKRDLQNETASLRAVFYEVLYRDTAVEILTRGDTDLRKTVEMLRERERAGEGSGYDVLRAEQETAELQLELGRAQAASATARARFASFFDGSLAMSSAAMAGDFIVSELTWTAEEAVAVALESRADLLALEKENRGQEMEFRAARRERFPEPVLTGGWKRVEALGESDTGFVASLMVPLPVFDRGKFAAARARAASGQVDLQRQILEREIRAEVESALVQAQTARDAARRFGQSADQRANELRHIAQLAYDEGERGILELLDAFRTSVRVELQALAARHEAKQEQIELDRVLGREVRP
jgi:cobalt-zinc-cadmium efflux system outer membrane protein